LNADQDFTWDNPGVPISETVSALAMVPADDNQSYHFVAISASYPLTSKNKSELLAFLNQDISAFGEVQKLYDKNSEAGEIVISTDRAAMVARRIIDKMVRDEEAAASLLK
jgi:hypothetical protein